MLGETRRVRLYGGPLHGEWREVGAEHAAAEFAGVTPARAIGSDLPMMCWHRYRVEPEGFAVYESCWVTRMDESVDYVRSLGEWWKESGQQ